MKPRKRRVGSLTVTVFCGHAKLFLQIPEKACPGILTEKERRELLKIGLRVMKRMDPDALRNWEA